MIKECRSKVTKRNVHDMKTNTTSRNCKSRQHHDVECIMDYRIQSERIGKRRQKSKLRLVEGRDLRHRSVQSLLMGQEFSDHTRTLDVTSTETGVNSTDCRVESEETIKVRINVICWKPQRFDEKEDVRSRREKLQSHNHLSREISSENSWNACEWSYMTTCKSTWLRAYSQSEICPPFKDRWCTDEQSTIRQRGALIGGKADVHERYKQCDGHRL